MVEKEIPETETKMMEKEIPETKIKMGEKEIPVTLNKNHVDLLQTIPDSWILRYWCVNRK